MPELRVLSRSSVSRAVADPVTARRPRDLCNTFRMSHFLLVPVLMLVLLAGSCAIGAWIGSTKDRTALGTVLGVFGIFGWLIIALMPAHSRVPARST